MEAVVPPFAEARDDYAILSGLSRHLDVEGAFTEGRTSDDWLRWLYDESIVTAQATGITLPPYTEFLAKGWHYVDPIETGHGALTAFRKDPLKAPLKTPSGRIEISSDHIAAHHNRDVLSHPAWYPPSEWLGNATKQYPFHLISGQPADKLHSQLDHGPVSRAAKINGRMPVGVNPIDAKANGIVEGDLLRVFNDRGACLACAAFDATLMKGCVSISTGGWLDVERQQNGTLLCRNGNPNTLTPDRGTSTLAQGPTAHSCLVNIEKVATPAGSSQAYSPPVFK